MNGVFGRALLSLLALSLLACAGRERVRYVSPDFHLRAPARVAVLPFDNMSVDLAGPGLVRTLASERLRSLGYDPLSDESVDEALQGLGFQDGGQLRATTPLELGRALGAPALFYGVLEEFTFMNVGFAVRRVVRLHLKLVLAETGETLWEDTGEGLTKRFTLKKKGAARALMEGVFEKAVENVFRTPLLPEAREAVRRTLRRLPPPAPRGPPPGATSDLPL